MKRLPYFIMLAALAVAPCASQGQPKPMAPSMVGVGSHGYDWLIGTWACTNTIPSPIGGPKNTTLTFAHSGAGGSLLVRIAGTGFSETGYVAYNSKTKTWWNPTAFADGSYSGESSTGTGKRVIYTGTFFNAASGKTMPIRDTYTTFSATKQNDLGEYQSGGAWKTLYNTTCTKS